MKFLSQINVNTRYTLPIVDGTNGQVLTTDGNGVAYWSSTAGATNLNALTDVELTSPSTGQILRYEIPMGGSVPVWRNVTPAYLDPNSSINALGDVTITSAVAGQILQFNGTFWINTTLSTVEYVSKVQHTVKAGAAITKGQAVYVTTSDGTNMVVGLASNASEATSSKVIGLAASNAAINDQIFVVTEGLLSGLNTSTATAGDPVWLGTGGNLIFGLANKPVAPAHLVYIGVVTRVQSNNGEIFVNVQNGFELNEIHDALIVSPTAGQLLRRDSDNLWKNWTPNYLTAHPTIANGGSVDNSNGTVIQDITLETNGHVTAITSVDLDTRYYTQNDISGIFGGEIPMAGYNPTNWDAAYGWGNHASAGYATTSYVTTAIANLVDSAPSTLDTLNELAAALGDDPNFATTVTNSIAGKVSKSGESHDSVLPNTLGAGQGGFYTVASGYGPSGGNDALIHIPYAINDWAHQIAMDWATGDSQDMWFRTKHNGTWQAWKKVWHDGNFTDNSSNWNTAYGWGNHALAGYATQTWVGLNYYNSGQIDDFFSGAEAISGYNKSNWDAAYNDKVNSASFNTTNGVLTLTQQDGGTVTVDLDGRYLTSDTDAQTLTWETPTKNLSITNGNTVTLEGLATEDYVLSQGFISSESDTLASVTGRGASTTNAITVGGATINGTWQTVISTGGGWNKLSFVASNAWGDGTTYGVLGAGGGAEPGVMTYNQHATWVGSSNGAGIRMGRSGGVASGAWYQVATMDSDEFMIAKNGQWSNGGIKITSGGELQHGNSGNKYWHAGNDGSGSGLDADLLDGNHASAFATRQDGARYSTDFNSILSSGFFNAEGQPANAPDDYGQLIVAKGIDTGLQIFGGYDSNNLWFRGWGYGPEANGFYPWRKVWHDGNDGSSSGLDADLLDGNHASAFYLATNPSGYITGSYLDDYTRGAYRVISDYGSNSTWYIRSNGQFVFGTGHDWTASFRLNIDNGSGYGSNGSWAYFGQQDSNATNGTWRGVRIRKFAGGSAVDGDLSAGAYYIGTTRKDTNWDAAYSWGNHADAPYWNVSLNQNIQVESQQVTFAGDVVIQGTLTESSSIRFKENIAPLDQALDKVNQLEAVSYNKIGEDNREIGLIAEEVAELFPEVVTHNDEGQPQGIQYQRLSVILLKAVQELSQEVNELKKKLN